MKWNTSHTFQERKEAMRKAEKSLSEATSSVRKQASVEIDRHLRNAEEELDRCLAYVKKTPGSSNLDDSFLQNDLQKQLGLMQQTAKKVRALLGKLE